MTRYIFPSDVLGEAITAKVGHDRSAEATIAVLDALHAEGFRIVNRENLPAELRALREAAEAALPAIAAALEHGDLTQLGEAGAALRGVLGLAPVGRR